DYQPIQAESMLVGHPAGKRYWHSLPPLVFDQGKDRPGDRYLDVLPKSAESADSRVRRVCGLGKVADPLHMFLEDRLEGLLSVRESVSLHARSEGCQWNGDLEGGRVPVTG